MHRITTTALTAAVAALTLAGCSSTPDPDSVSPAQKLADLDGDARPTADYARILNQLGPKCTQGVAGMAALSYGTWKVLHDDGVTDETQYSVLKHLNTSAPAGLPKTDCRSIAAAYVTLREG